MPEFETEFEFETPGLTPEEALAFWKDRIPLTESEIRQLSEGARSRAFTAAGLARQEQVALVHQALQEAIENGTGLKEFKERIAPLLAEKGWQGHRVANILRTNMQTAYSAGRWAQMQSTKKYFPYLEYYTVGDRRVRPSHAVLGGMVFPIDHPFWDANYPPNGFSCRCGARAVSGREVERRGLEVQKEIPRDLLYKDPKTGMEYRVARPGADDGFRHNPGKDWLAGLQPGPVDFREPGKGKPKGVFLCRSPRNFSSITEGDACFVSLADIPEKHIIKVNSKDLLPGGLNEEAYINAFLKEFGVRYGQSKLFRLPGIEFPLVINEQLFVDKQSKAFKVKKSGRERYLKLLAQTIKNPYEIWSHPTTFRNGQTFQTLSLIRLFMLEDEDRKIGGLGIFRLYEGNKWDGSTVFTPKVESDEDYMIKYLDKLRRGILLEHGNAALLYREK